MVKISGDSIADQRNKNSHNPHGYHGNHYTVANILEITLACQQFFYVSKPKIRRQAKKIPARLIQAFKCVDHYQVYWEQYEQCSSQKNEIAQRMPDKGFCGVMSYAAV